MRDRRSLCSPWASSPSSYSLGSSASADVIANAVAANGVVNRPRFPNLSAAPVLAHATTPRRLLAEYANANAPSKLSTTDVDANRRAKYGLSVMKTFHGKSAPTPTARNTVVNTRSSRADMTRAMTRERVARAAATARRRARRGDDGRASSNE